MITQAEAGHRLYQEFPLEVPVFRGDDLKKCKHSHMPEKTNETMTMPHAAEIFRNLTLKPPVVPPSILEEIPDVFMERYG